MTEQQQAPQNETWLTVKRVGEILGYSRPKVYDLIYAGHIKTALVPGRAGSRGEYRIRRSEVERFMAECEAQMAQQFNRA